jgi:hypothetical protein
VSCVGDDVAAEHDLRVDLERVGSSDFAAWLAALVWGDRGRPQACECDMRVREGSDCPKS